MDAANQLALFYNHGVDVDSDLDLDDGLEDDDAYRATKKVSFNWKFTFNRDQVFQMKIDPIYKLYLMTRSNPRRLNSFGWVGRMDKAMFPTAANMKEEPKVFRHVGLRKWGKPESRYTCELPTNVGGMSTADRKSNIVMLPSIIGPICYLLSVCNENLEFNMLELKLFMDCALLYSPYSYLRDCNVNECIQHVSRDEARTISIVLADANLRAVFAFTKNRSVFLDESETSRINDNFETHGIEDQNVFDVYGEPSLVERIFGFPREDMKLYKQHIENTKTKSKRATKSNSNSNDNNRNSNTRRGHSSHHHSSHRHSSHHHSSHHGARSSDRGDRSRSGKGDRSRSGKGGSSRTGKGGSSRSGKGGSSRTGKGGTTRSGRGGRSRSGRGGSSRSGRGGRSRSGRGGSSRSGRGGKSRSNSNQHKARDVI